MASRSAGWPSVGPWRHDASASLQDVEDGLLKGGGWKQIDGRLTGRER